MRECQDVVHRLCSLEASPYATKYVPNLKLSHQVLAPGQAEVSFTERLSRVLSELSVQYLVDSSLPKTVSLIATVL